MELDFNKIIRLKKIRIEKSELSEEENALTAPILKDKSLIHEIYKIFVELLNERGCPPNIDSVTQRKKFIFIILYLFSPSSLAGGKMTAGLRPELARVLGVQSECTISDNCADVVFLYQNYGDFSGGYRVSLHRNRKSVKNQRANQLMSRSLVLRLFCSQMVNNTLQPICIFRIENKFVKISICTSMTKYVLNSMDNSFEYISFGF